MMANMLITAREGRLWARFGWRDAAIFVAFFAALLAFMHTLQLMTSALTPPAFSISLSPSALPGYAWRSVVRMFLAYGISLAFALTMGRIAAYNRRAELVLIPTLDILQSIPVLGFVSVTVTGFMTLFPGSVLGLECVSIVAIFSSMAWNIAFSFYQSLKTIPRELHEAAVNFRLTPSQRFIKLEVPFAMTGLVWNSMVSFGSGWFFLAASEAITVLNKNYQLPGLGSFMAEAVRQKDVAAIISAIGAIVAVVVLVDQLFWRPVVAWAQKYRIEGRDDDQPTSVILDILRNSQLQAWFTDRVLAPTGGWIQRIIGRMEAREARRPGHSRLLAVLRWIVVIPLVIIGVSLILRGVSLAVFSWTLPMIGHTAWLGLLTLLRVTAVVILASIIWVPIGVRIGFSPKLAKIAQPLVQIGAAFPANVIFPLITFAFVATGVPLSWGSILLLMVGTQWYVLFNVIAGALQVPADLREAAQVFGLRGWNRWRRLVLPAIFPAWVTGALTAAGGAWNASIVAEVAVWGDTTLTAPGLGALITETTQKGDWPGIILSIAMMCAYVVLLNRLVWQKLYEIAEERFRMT